MRAWWLVLALGCGGAAPTAVARPEPAPSHAPVIARLVTTPCFGRCTVYEAVLRADGELALTRNGADPHRVRLDEARLQAVAAAFAQARFFELDEQGFSPTSSTSSPASAAGTFEFEDRAVCSDTSSTHVTYVEGDRERTIATDHCEPSELTRLEGRLVELLEIEAWLARP